MKPWLFLDDGHMSQVVNSKKKSPMETSQSCRVAAEIKSDSSSSI